MYMIYRDNRHPQWAFWRVQNPQSGITLLLSMLLLAAITTITFSLAAVGYAELATSTDLLHTEPILYASIGAAEEATFGLKRNEPTLVASLGTNCDPDFSLFSFSLLSGLQSTITNQTKLCNVNPNNDIEVEVPVTANTPSGYALARRLYLYDPSKNTVGDSLYTNITFRKTSSSIASDIKMYICQLDVDCVGPWPGTGNWYQANTTLSYNVDVPVALTSDAVTGCCSYEVILMNVGTQPGYVEVITTGKTNGVDGPKGLPYLNKKSVEIQSSAGRLIRRLRVLVPVQ